MKVLIVQAEIAADHAVIIQISHVVAPICRVASPRLNRYRAVIQYQPIVAIWHLHAYGRLFQST